MCGNVNKLYGISKLEKYANLVENFYTMNDRLLGNAPFGPDCRACTMGAMTITILCGLADDKRFSLSDSPFEFRMIGANAGI